MKQLKKSKRPGVLTVKGKAAAIVQDAEAYQRLLDLAASADAEEGIRQGLEDVKKGRTRPPGSSLTSSKPRMAYLVNITSRAERDLAQLYMQVNAEYSTAALKWYKGLKEAILSLEEHPNRCPLPRKSDRLRHLLADLSKVIAQCSHGLNTATPMG